MRYLDIIQNRINLSKEDFELVKDDVKVIYEKLREREIKFTDENFEITFYNHVASLTKRIIENELIDPLPEEFMTESTEEAMEIARYLVGDIFNKYKVKEDITEVFLVSTHIQLTLM